MSNRITMDRSWKLKARAKALKATAEKYHITQKEVRETLKLAAEYLHAQVEAIDLEGDLYDSYTRIQIPGFRTYLNVHKVLVLESMYENGRMSKKQWYKMLERYERRLNYTSKGIKNYKAKEDERNNIRQSKTS